MRAAGVMSDRALLLVLVLHLAAVVAGGIPHIPTPRRVASSWGAQIEDQLEDLEQEGSPERRLMNGAPPGGAPECPCLELGSPKLAAARAVFKEMGMPVRRLLPATRLPDHNSSPRVFHLNPHLPPSHLLARHQSLAFWHL